MGVVVDNLERGLTPHRPAVLKGKIALFEIVERPAPGLRREQQCQRGVFFGIDAGDGIHDDAEFSGHGLLATVCG